MTDPYLVRPALLVFFVVTLFVACACALFGPQERADVIALATAERIEWDQALKRREVSPAQHGEAVARLDRIEAAAKDEDSRDLLLDIGLVLAGAAGGRAKQIAGGVAKVIRRRKTAAKVKSGT